MQILAQIGQIKTIQNLLELENEQALLTILLYCIFVLLPEINVTHGDICDNVTYIILYIIIYIIFREIM